MKNEATLMPPNEMVEWLKKWEAPEGWRRSILIDVEENSVVVLLDNDQYGMVKFMIGTELSPRDLDAQLRDACKTFEGLRTQDSETMMFRGKAAPRRDSPENN